jgi:death-on-curing protein
LWLDIARHSRTLRSEPAWLSLADVLATNKEAVEATGENHFVRDNGLLESAIAKPQNHWNYGEDDVVVLAVKLLLGIAQNHPFEQGNKRTALTAAATFLELNGYELDVPDGDPFGNFIERVITGEFSEAEFTELIRPCVNELPEDPA